jgi:hypothetical protein
MTCLFSNDDAYEQLKSDVIEIKRMLNSLLRTIQTDARGSQTASAQLSKRLQR